MTSTHHTPKTAAVTAVAAWALAAKPVTVTGDIPESYTPLAAVLGEAGSASVRQAGQRRHQQRWITSRTRRTTTHHRRCAGPRW